MFDNIFTKIPDYEKFKSNPNNLKLLEDFIIFIFFNDDRKIAEIEIKKLRKQVNSDEEFWVLFLKKYKFPDIFRSFSELAAMSNISSVISTVASVQDKSKEVKDYSDKNKYILERFANYYKLRQNDILKVLSNQLDIPQKNVNEKNLKTNLFYTCKQSISDEFGVNKRTFNKWLEMSGLGEKYKGKRKINFDEYIEIFTTLFISENEEFDITNNVQIYRNRIKKGMKFNKSDITYLLDSDLKTQKDNLKKIEEYNFTDVFSYSTSKLFIEKMGGEINF